MQSLGEIDLERGMLSLLIRWPTWRSEDSGMARCHTLRIGRTNSSADTLPSTIRLRISRWPCPLVVRISNASCDPHSPQAGSKKKSATIFT